MGCRQTGFSQSSMETTDTPHDAWMTKARKVYFSPNRAQVWPQTAAMKSCEELPEPLEIKIDDKHVLSFSMSSLLLLSQYCRVRQYSGKVLIFNTIFHTSGPKTLCVLAVTTFISTLERSRTVFFFLFKYFKKNINYRSVVIIVDFKILTRYQKER